MSDLSMDIALLGPTMLTVLLLLTTTFPAAMTVLIVAVVRHRRRERRWHELVNAVESDGRTGLQTALGGLAYPRFNAFVLHQVVKVQIGLNALELVGRGAGGEGVQAVGKLMRKLQANCAANGFTHQVRLINAEVIHQVGQISGKPF